MYSNLVPFESVVERVKDDTGMTIAKNQYPRIRRLLYRAEHDLGYGGTVILKKVKYSIEDGTMLYDGNIYKLKLPDDITHLEKMGSCSENKMHPKDWRIQGNWMFFCNGVRPEVFTLYYYTLLHDGNGNPVTTENHFEAVTAGIVYWLFKQQVFSGRRNANLMMYYENYYHDRLGEARGADVFPSTDEEWKRIAEKLRWSYRDALIYSEDKECFCEVPESFLTTSVDPGGTTGGGGGYTNPNITAPGGGGAGTGSGGDTDGDGGYEPEPTVDPTANEPATIGDVTIEVSTNQPKVITIAMFESGAGAPYSDPENDDLAAVRVDAINVNNLGVWYFNGLPINVGTIVIRSQIIAELFTYVPAETIEPHTDSITISVKDAVNGTWVN